MSEIVIQFAIIRVFILEQDDDQHSSCDSTTFNETILILMPRSSALQSLFLTRQTLLRRVLWTKFSLKAEITPEKKILSPAVSQKYHRREEKNSSASFRFLRQLLSFFGYHPHISLLSSAWLFASSSPFLTCKGSSQWSQWHQKRQKKERKEAEKSLCSAK